MKIPSVINLFLEKAPRVIDVWVMAIFCILVTWHPYYLRGEFNEFEMGLYLPGIDGVLRGLVPFRDFFHLRGPCELYFPALLMRIFGENAAVLATWFYVGNVLTLLIFIAIAQQLFRSRLVFYLCIPVLIARTFPRVVFTYWGGMRYAWGALAIYTALRFLKYKNSKWAFGTGICFVIGLLTSIEIGICILIGMVLALAFTAVVYSEQRDLCWRGWVMFVLGTLAVFLPYGCYLASQGALTDYIQAVWTVVSRMEKVINLNFISEIPNNPAEAILAMLNPVSPNFKHMTPGYCYVAWGIVLFVWLKKGIRPQFLPWLVLLGGYGLVMYNSAFRAIHASQFEMALQPEKLLYFFILETLLFWLVRNHELVSTLQAPFRINWQHRYHFAAPVFLIILISFSVGYSLQRYNHRFFAFKFIRNVILGKDTSALRPLANEDMVLLDLPRMKGFVVPRQQAEDYRKLTEYFDRVSNPQEKVLFFPELGAQQFIVNRPFAGKYPMATFAWFRDEWHQRLMDDLRTNPPPYAVAAKEVSDWFPGVYFRLPENKRKFDEVRKFIDGHYDLEEETPSLQIFRRKSTASAS